MKRCRSDTRASGRHAGASPACVAYQRRTVWVPAARRKRYPEGANLVEAGSRAARRPVASASAEPRSACSDLLWTSSRTSTTVISPSRAFATGDVRPRTDHAARCGARHSRASNCSPRWRSASLDTISVDDRVNTLCSVVVPGFNSVEIGVRYESVDGPAFDHRNRAKKSASVRTYACRSWRAAAVGELALGTAGTRAPYTDDDIAFATELARRPPPPRRVRDRKRPSCKSGNATSRRRSSTACSPGGRSRCPRPRV